MWNEEYNKDRTYICTQYCLDVYENIDLSHRYKVQGKFPEARRWEKYRGIGQKKQTSGYD